MLNIKSINFGCHKIPERCFSFKGKPMPFCSRCLGCSIGHIFAFLLFLSDKLPSFLFAIVLIIPLAVDWSIQKFLGVISNNFRRLITGILGGFGIGIVMWKIIELLITSFT